MRAEIENGILKMTAETEKESYDLKEWYENYLIRLDLITVANDKGNLIVNATSNL